MSKTIEPSEIRRFAKQIFKESEPEVAYNRSGDIIIHSFKRFFPRNVCVFIPNDIDYEMAFLKPFEDYFTRDTYIGIERFAHSLEVPLRADLPKYVFECIPGASINLGIGGLGLAFTYRFDELVPIRQKTRLLCRALVKNLCEGDRLYIKNVCFPVCCREELTNARGDEYLYWMMRITDFFDDADEVVPAVLPYF